MHANRRLPNPPSRRLGSSSRRLDGSWRLAEQDGLWARWRWILATAAQKLEVNLRKRAKTAVVLDGLAIAAAAPPMQDALNAVAEDAAKLTEMRRVVVHGLLHLCGQKDKTPRANAQMHRKEDHYLRQWDELSKGLK